MRLTDDRYSRDRLRLDLALRFIRHEARTQTIRQWTGLTDDRIRKLYRSYVRSEPANGVRRRRGKSPRQASFFMRSRDAQQQTAALASIMSICGVLSDEAVAPVASGGSTMLAESVREACSGLGRPAPAMRLRATLSLSSPHDAATAVRPGARAPGGVVRGERLCAAYEAYARAIPQPMITFEHAVFLATALAGGAELRTQGCPSCGSLGVVDPIALRAQPCLDCGQVLNRGLRGRTRRS